MGCLTSLIGLIWAAIIILKIAEVGLAASMSWWFVIFWPIAPLLLIFVLSVLILIIAN